ncbi:MAG: PIN domain-containing protein [Oscillospiraceae bacterium]|jgi:predicted nucleic acid-binding protein|nr:PIN domain-containing protein [Oscillospiraceae bacterium]
MSADNINRAFLDTNIFIYMYAVSEPHKKETSLSLLDSCDCVTSTQAINEICNVLTRKIRTPFEDIRKIVNDIYNICEVRLIQKQTGLNTIDLKERYGFSFYDSLMLSSALESNCNILYSEDMADGQTIEGKLKIVNPFKK